jgi:hypothetical protein
MNRRSFLPIFVLLPLVFTTIGCSSDDDNNNTPTAPTTPVTVTETFADTIARNGARTHNFTTQSSGQVTATLTTLSPDSALVVGFALGTWNGTLCQQVLVKDDATQGTVLFGGVSSFGSLCVRVYDVGNVTEPINYEITVVHP